MPSVAEFLIGRLENIGLKHAFGIPGDYVLPFYEKVTNNENINLINTVDESGAGFAADAYARVHGVGCCIVTYCVGGLKVCNPIAGAFAERSPVILISGSPGMKEREEDLLLHHMVRSFECQKEVFENITCDSVVLDNPATAGYAIDRVLTSLKRHKQPIYIELPRDVADKAIGYDLKQGTPKSPESDQENLAESIEEVSNWINEAKNPVILAGVEVSRLGLGKDLMKFAEKNDIPVATTLLSKSVVSERSPLFLGVYSGATSDSEVKEKVEGSDCLIMLGAYLTDMTTCFKPSKFKKRQTVSASIAGGIKIRSHTYEKVCFKDFSIELFKQDVPSRNSKAYKSKKPIKEFIPEEDTKITTNRLFEKIDSILDEDWAVVADIGDSLFGAIELNMHHSNHFLSPAFYTSMGFSIPGALGVQLANPSVRPIVVVGDGAFQMSFGEISTILDNGLNPIIFVLNNKGYTTERFILDGEFNNIRNWDYSSITKLYNGGKSGKVETEEDLEKVTKEALESEEVFIVDVALESMDVSNALKRVTEGLSKRCK
jgi:indolepyruvate decarboxylase